METLTPHQYEALPESEKPYWERIEQRFPLVTVVEYTPVTIPLIEVVKVLEELKVEDNGNRYFEAFNYALTTAINKIKERK